MAEERKKQSTRARIKKRAKGNRRKEKGGKRRNRN